jgi:octaprenyl-diphosphate synthase
LSSALAISNPFQEPPRSALDRARALIGSDLQQVDRTILDRLQSDIPLIPELARHLIAAGGKRIRPMLTLLSARVCGYAGRHHIALATAVEFIHTATLLHDDVVDESDLRRGTATANAVWGNKAPVLVGDFLFSRSFQLMVEAGSMETLGILANASAVIAEGEVMQLVTANDIESGEDAYLAMISAKTAALFKAACEIGGVIAARPRRETAALAEYGQNLGIAFQLIDDALDYSAREAELGKTVGDDFREGKITLPVLVAFAAGDEAERAFWRRCLEEVQQDEDDLGRAQALLTRHEAIPATVARAEEYGARAREALRGFPRSEAREVLNGLIDFCIERAY